jgi:GT2 family glycosyltransferase
MLSRLVAAQTADPTLGVVGPLIYYADPADEVWFSGQRFWRQLYVVRRGLHLDSLTKPVVEVDFISGCGMLVPRMVWEQVGVLAPEYFMYYEDLDFCIRAKKQGYRIGCVPQATMWHAVSKSSGGMDSPNKQRLQVQSSLIFFWRHTTGLWFVVNASIRIAHAGYSLIRALFRGTLKLATIREFGRGILNGWRQRKA